MGKFAEVITSFERNGNFPLEANYIFPTVEALKQFYTDPIQAATLHKGLFKVVEKGPGNKQTLYWVTKKADSEDLKFTPLQTGETSADELGELHALIIAETQNRGDEDQRIWGDTVANPLPDEYKDISLLAKGLKVQDQKWNTLMNSSSHLKVVKQAVPDTGNIATYQIVWNDHAVIDKINVPQQPSSAAFEWIDV